MTAVALLDGQVGPEQIETERVNRSDVQHLLSRVDVKPAPDLTAAYPDRTAARVHVVTRDGRTLSREQSDFEGSPTRPMSWDRVVDKFDWLAEPFADDGLRADIVAAVANLEHIAVSELAELLAAVSPTAERQRTRGRL
ncbi:MmgE/PrpD family protein [Mycobacterium sp. ACS1612]|uniref:MmgE/PrpD family protein n=1 Tax=Mycobacterium sp. ACS1612 TaxID=1834117 RepID=UPI000AF1BDC5|nr:MmgE/PrpD family protein [Mycobacterium sp. ACS1612]